MTDLISNRQVSNVCSCAQSEVGRGSGFEFSNSEFRSVHAQYHSYSPLCVILLWIISNFSYVLLSLVSICKCESFVICLRFASSFQKWIHLCLSLRSLPVIRCSLFAPETSRLPSIPTIFWPKCVSSAAFFKFPMSFEFFFHKERSNQLAPC